MKFCASEENMNKKEFLKIYSFLFEERIFKGGKAQTIPRLGF
jgi:hypothetical protein